jgi:hypothetical protein
MMCCSAGRRQLKDERDRWTRLQERSSDYPFFADREIRITVHDRSCRIGDQVKGQTAAVPSKRDEPKLLDDHGVDARELLPQARQLAGGRALRELAGPIWPSGSLPPAQPR